MNDKKIQFDRLDLHLKNKKTIESIKKICEETGLNKTTVAISLIETGLKIYEQTNDLSAISNKENIEDKFRGDVLRKLNLILDRQMTARVYDKVIERLANSIYQYVLLLLTFSTNGKYTPDDEDKTDVLNKTPREIASYKNDLLYQLVEGSNLLDKNERDVK